MGEALVAYQINDPAHVVSETMVLAAGVMLTFMGRDAAVLSSQSGAVVTVDAVTMTTAAHAGKPMSELK